MKKIYYNIPIRLRRRSLRIPGRSPIRTFGSGTILYESQIVRLFLICIVLFALAGCNKENPGFIPDSSGDENKTVTFRIRIPQNSHPETTGTRALTAVQEAEVREVDILVFGPGGGNFLYNTSAKLITKDPEGSNADYRFTAMLEETTSCDIVLITNARTAVQTFLTAQGNTPFTKTTLQAGLVLESSNPSYFNNHGKWDTQTPALFPMWGEDLNRQVIKESVIEGIMLHRMIARINVRITADNFQLREVYLYNSTTKGSVIPDATRWDSNWKSENADPADPSVGKATAPSMPAGWDYGSQPLIYSYANNEVLDKSCLNEIYTFEAPPGDATSGPGNTFLVIGGLYDGSSTVTYYRIDIAEKNQPGIYEYLPLLRNHTYEFTVSSVARKGYETAAIAAAAGPENTEVVLVIENDSELRYYVSDSHYYIGITEQIVRLAYNASVETHTLKIKTNYPTGWNIRVSGSETNADTPCSWIALTTSLPSTGDELTYIVTPNDAWTVRRAYLHIAAGVEMVVTIEQESKDAIELPTVSPTGSIPAAGQTRTVTVTGLFDSPIPVRVRDKYDTQALDSGNVPVNAPGGAPVSTNLTIPAWNSDDPRSLVFEYQDPANSEWRIFHEDHQEGYSFQVSTTLAEGGTIPEKPGIADYTVTVSGSAWPLIHVRAINSSSLEVITDPLSITGGNDGIAKTITLPIHAYGQWNDQVARIVELQWSKDGVIWNTLCSGTQKGWYRITGTSYKIYHPGTTERSDISHDGARVVVTVAGDFPDGVVEVRLGSSDVQVARPAGDGVSANTATELLCRYNRTILSRNIPLSYRIFVNNAWQAWVYEGKDVPTGNIQTFVQPSIACELPTTGRIIARQDALTLGITEDPFMSWSTAMGIASTYNTNDYPFNVSTGNYPDYGGIDFLGNPFGGCSLYYEGNDPDDPVTGQGKWFLWGDGMDETKGEAQFFVQRFSKERTQLLGLSSGTEYWTVMESPNPQYQMTIQILEDRWQIAYKYKPDAGRYSIRARCVRYPTASEKQQFENGYAPDVVTTY